MSKNYNSIYKRSKSFIEKSKIVHNNKYSYSNLNYKNVDEKVEIICPIHGSFFQSPRIHLYKRGGCNKCALDRSKIANTKTTEKFIGESQLIHNNKYDYSHVEYINAHTTVDIICPIHGLFSQIAMLHAVKGHGCKKCAQRLSLDEFIERANRVHNNLYTYDGVNYQTGKLKIGITCLKHGIFKQSAESHLAGHGCPKCSGRFSNIAIKWLENIAECNNIFIQHATNLGEYHIPLTRYMADGYCSETNTIYEFYGDCFHGNPNAFNSDEKCNPFNKAITASELYDNTMTREQKIKQLGYNLITIWESEFKNLS